MQFTTATIAAAFLALTSAAPTPSAAPTYWAPSTGSVIVPKTISQYSVWSGAVAYNAQYGKIFKNGRTTDITTLMTFEIPAAAQGKTCQFHFFLDAYSTLSGTGTFDIFTSLAPATQSTTTWPSGNLRDQHAGRMQAHKDSEATYVAGFPNAAQSFPCPYGHILAGELVGAGDALDIEWDEYSAGAYISYY